MPGEHLPVTGMDLLVPVVAAVVGIAAGAAVRHHARRYGIDRPWIWAIVVGAAFVAGPILLRPTLRPVYGHMFVPVNSESVLLIQAVDPLGALATYLVGGSVVGIAVLAGYLGYCCRVTFRRAERA